MPVFTVNCKVGYAPRELNFVKLEEADFASLKFRDLAEASC